MTNKHFYSGYFIKMSKNDKEERKEELIKQCKDYPEILGRDYADLEEEYFSLMEENSKLYRLLEILCKNNTDLEEYISRAV